MEAKFKIRIQQKFIKISTQYSHMKEKNIKKNQKLFHMITTKYRGKLHSKYDRRVSGYNSMKT